MTRSIEARSRNSTADSVSPRWRRAAAYAASTASKEERPRKARCTEEGKGGSAREQPVITPRVPSEPMKSWPRS